MSKPTAHTLGELASVDSAPASVVYIAGREVSYSQVPHIEADIASAKVILTQLLSLTATSCSEVSFIAPVIQEVEV